MLLYDAGGSTVTYPFGNKIGIRQHMVFDITGASKKPENIFAKNNFDMKKVYENTNFIIYKSQEKQ